MIKGNVIVGQSGGPTAVINSSLVGVFKKAKELGAKKIYGMRNGLQGLLSGNYVDLYEHIDSDLTIEILKRTPSSYLGSCRYKLPDYRGNSSDYVRLFALMQDLDIKYFFYIGGNDSMDTIMKLSEYAESIGSDIRFVGIPKTIDNDLCITDHTPGYGSAAKYIASVTKEILCDSLVYEMDSICILEIMGRDAGWLTAASALAKDEDCSGPDLVYLPEKPFDAEEFIESVKQKQRERKSLVVTVSEGIKTKGGEYFCNSCGSIEEDVFGHKPLGGTAECLAALVGEKLGIKARGVTLGTLQRCASHMVSRTDITEAFMTGGYAVKAAVNGETGKMVTIKRLSDDPYNVDISFCDVHEAANKVKKLPPEWINKNNDGVSRECINYMQPLIIGELEPFMVNGLPRHLYLE